METVLQLIVRYGYAGIFSLLVLGIIGLPVPDEWLLTFAGYLVYRKTLHLIPTFASASLGSICGITVSYVIGRSLGIYVLHHYGRLFRITPEMMEKTHAWFDRFGTWTLLGGYFLPGIRHVTAIVAGTSRLRPVLFSIFAYTGALVWSATFIGLGFYFGDEWTRVLWQVQRHLVVVAWLVLMSITIWLLWRYKTRGRS